MQEISDGVAMEMTDGRSRAVDYGPLGPSSLAGHVVRVLGEDRWGRVKSYHKDKENADPGSGFQVNDRQGPGWVSVLFSGSKTPERIPRNRVVPVHSEWPSNRVPDGYEVPK